MQITLVPPQNPPKAGVGKPELMPRRVDRDHPRDLKVPLQVRVRERRDERPRGAVDVDGDVQPGSLLQVVD